jgi:hypothetical protein
MGKTFISATAGSLIGIGEVILLPLDALKVKDSVYVMALVGRLRGTQSWRWFCPFWRQCGCKNVHEH